MAEPGVRVIHENDLKVLLKEAAREGACEALAAIGLTGAAREDIQLVLELGRGLREMRREIWRQIGRAVFWAMIGGAVVWFAGFKLPWR